jgi:hypothetical protein
LAMGARYRRAAWACLGRRSRESLSFEDPLKIVLLRLLAQAEALQNRYAVSHELACHGHMTRRGARGSQERTPKGAMASTCHYCGLWSRQQRSSRSPGEVYTIYDLVSPSDGHKPGI